MAHDSTVNRVTQSGLLLHQLRQLRTKFSSSSTYGMFRASGPLTKNHASQPYTLFTLAEADRGRQPCAMGFRQVAMQVIKHGNDAVISKADIWSLTNEAVGETNAKMMSILALFGEALTLPIIGNDSLNTLLEELAELLMSSIVSANEAVAKQVVNAVEYLN